MKTTRKEYLTKSEEKKELRNQMMDAEYREDFDTYFKKKKEIEKLEKEYFDLLPKVNVSYMCGYRNFYESVVKIGKTYFKSGEAMTQGRGFRCIEEVDSITDEMKNEMISDTYYY